MREDRFSSIMFHHYSHANFGEKTEHMQLSKDAHEMFVHTTHL